MSEYQLKKGESLNGGYSVVIGDYTLRLIGGYEVSWTNEYDTENQFTDYKGDTVRLLRGRRFSLRISTGRLSAEDIAALEQEIKKDKLTLECPDFTGECYCEGISAKLAQANFLGSKYKSDFTFTACELDRSEVGDGL